MADQQQIEEIRKNIIEAFGQSVGVYGMNETIGRIYGMLYFEDNPLSLEEMADKLGVSKATISINIRLLLELKVVQKIWVKGTRKDHYLAERDFNKIIQEVLKSKELHQLNLIKGAIQLSNKQYNSVFSEGDEELKEIARADMEKLKELDRLASIGERWLYFLLETQGDSGPPEEVQEIEVEWND